ncbi:putative metal-binding motif-containing protein [Pleionea sediminis]|uniref:putative metal-binding motif-containing protein n=1 Tax=Pleionea sediminis TaxID=2569479 RepID=UPI001FE640DE|nr:putative metal-binding motif-containing protein [Pleionea sediminis]
MLIRKYLVVLSLIITNFGFFNVQAAEPIKPPSATINQDQIKNNATISIAEKNKLRKQLNKHRLDYRRYMDILKEHRAKAKDMQIIRQSSNARARTNIRSQNDQWRGTYDCNDMDASVKPGQVEACDGIDNNCNGDIDEGVTADLFLDADGDGWGDPNQRIKACHVESGYAARGNDCDDQNIQIYPGAADVAGDGIDANCDGNDG